MTHLDELKLLGLTAEAKGATVTFLRNFSLEPVPMAKLESIRDIDQVKVIGVPGMRDCCLPLIAFAEAARKVVGRDSYKPLLTNDYGVPHYHYSDLQGSARGGAMVFASDLVFSKKIAVNKKFIISFSVDGKVDGKKHRDTKVHYMANMDGAPYEFASKSSFDKFAENEVPVKFSHYYFDLTKNTSHRDLAFLVFDCKILIIDFS